MHVPRPLPNVDIPLLAHERRTRTRIVWLGPVVALTVGLGIAGGWLVRPWLWGGKEAKELTPSEDKGVLSPTKGSGATPPSPAYKSTNTPLGEKSTEEHSKAATSASPTHPELTRTTAVFGKAKGFQQAVTLAGVSESDAEVLVNSMKSVLDFRRCRPEDQLVIERDTQGKLYGFEYHLSPVKIYRAERQLTGAFVTRQKEVKLDTTRIARAGKVQTSLGDALEAVGLGRTLVGVFVQVFERRMNFSTDTRQGDTFRIIVDEEKLRGTFWRYSVTYALEYRSQKHGVLRAYWFEGTRGEPEFFSDNGSAVQGGWMRTPLQYEYISSGFTERRFHPVVKRVLPHQGVDYVAAMGTPVWACADGRVTFVGQKGPNGNLVIVHHNNGYQSFYAHLSRFAGGIKVGKRVSQREVLGYVGSTGRSTGPHLHFGLKRGGRFLNPLQVLNTPGPPLTGKSAQRFRAHAQALQNQLDRIPI